MLRSRYKGRALLGVLLVVSLTFGMLWRLPTGGRAQEAPAFSFSMYTYAGNCSWKKSDPVTMVFYGPTASAWNVRDTIQEHLTTWAPTAGSHQSVRYAGSQTWSPVGCVMESFQTGSSALGATPRYHARIFQAAYRGPNNEYYSASSPHYERLASCGPEQPPVFHVVPSDNTTTGPAAKRGGYVAGADKVRFVLDNFYPYGSSYWGNTRLMRQCDGTNAKSNGWVHFFQLGGITSRGRPPGFWDSPEPPFSRFALQTHTALHQTGAEFEFETTDWTSDGFLDLVAIAKAGSSGATEVHVLDGAGGFKSFLMQTTTALHQTGQSWEFEFADWNGDGWLDLFAIRKDTSTATEVHVLSGRAVYGQFIFQTVTALHPTGSNWEFKVVEWNGDSRPDLVAINRAGASGRTEIHVLSGATNFQTFLVQRATALHSTSVDWEFELADWNRDGWLDLFGINREGTGSDSTEVHILNGTTSYTTWLSQTPTELHPTGTSWEFEIADWTRDSIPDLIAIAKSQIGSRTTEVHILQG